VASALPANTIFHGRDFPRLRLFRYVQASKVCLPPRSFLPLQVSLQGSEAFTSSRTCVVTFAHASDMLSPTTGNWRNEDFHLERFTALSTAPYSLTLASRGLIPSQYVDGCVVVCIVLITHRTGTQNLLGLAVIGMLASTCEGKFD